jgi:hypothetical protein
MGVKYGLLFRYTVTCMGVLQTGFGLETRFTDHFNTRLVTTLNYSPIADLHTPQISTAHARCFQSAVSSPLVPWKRRPTVEIL